MKIELWMVLMFLSLCSIRCDNPQSNNCSPVGDWSYSEQMPGMPDIMVLQLSIKEDGTYTATGFITDGGNTITVLSEAGIWDQSGNRVTFDPGECKSYNFDTYTLESSICDDPVKYIIKNNELTNGTYIFKHEQD